MATRATADTKAARVPSPSGSAAGRGDAAVEVHGEAMLASVVEPRDEDPDLALAVIAGAWRSI